MWLLLLAACTEGVVSTDSDGSDVDTEPEPVPWTDDACAEIVGDSPFDDELFSQAARRVVESLRRLEDDRTFTERDEPSLRAGRPAPIPIPEHLQPAARAREIYVRWVRPHEDLEHVRDETTSTREGAR